MWGWSVDRQYTREDLPWEEHTWTLSEAQDKQAVGYTLKSLPSGPERIYNHLYKAITKGGDLFVPTDQVRPQIAIIEECLRQNPLPRKS